MITQRECDCCHQVKSINQWGLCFACQVFHTCTTIISEETDLSDGQALDLASELEDAILSLIVERLILPGQDHPLVTELLKTMERREEPN
jgi:hypothetical protein